MPKSARAVELSEPKVALSSLAGIACVALTSAFAAPPRSDMSSPPPASADFARINAVLLDSLSFVVLIPLDLSISLFSFLID
jgi:hypothetical protein